MRERVHKQIHRRTNATRRSRDKDDHETQGQETDDKTKTEQTRKQNRDSSAEATRNTKCIGCTQITVAHGKEELWANGVMASVFKNDEPNQVLSHDSA